MYLATILDLSEKDEYLFRQSKCNQRNIFLQRASILSTRVRRANENDFSRAPGNFDGQFCCRCRAGRNRPGFLNVFLQEEGIEAVAGASGGAGGEITLRSGREARPTPPGFF